MRVVCFMSAKVHLYIETLIVFLWFLAISVIQLGHMISLCMNKICNSIKEVCQYVGIIALACGSALVLLIMGNKRKCWGAWDASGMLSRMWLIEYGFGWLDWWCACGLIRQKQNKNTLWAYSHASSIWWLMSLMPLREWDSRRALEAFTIKCLTTLCSTGR